MRLRKEESGFTLTELMVAVMLLAVIGSATVGGLITVQRALDGVTRRNAELAQARSAINTVERQLRSALVPPDSAVSVPIQSIDQSSIVFFTAANAARVAGAGGRSQSPVPRRVELRVEADGRLIERVTLPTAQTGGTWVYTATPTQRVLATNVVAQGVFTPYCDRARPDLVCVDDPATTGLDERTQAVAVGLRVEVRVPGGSQSSVLASRARLVNRELAQ